MPDVRKAEPLTLVEIDLDSGTRYYSFSGVTVVGESNWFADKITSIGTVYRESPLIPSRPKIADTSVTIFDPKLLELKASEPFRGRTVRLRFGNALDPASITTLYTGYITDYRTDKGAMVLTIRDTSFDRLHETLEGRFTRADFPNIPTDDFQSDLLPVVYGELTSENLWDTGAVPCYRINDSTPYQYLVARHPCKEIVNVYNYETIMSTSNWDARLLDVNGELYQILEFASDPKTATRPDEFEITADVKGKTDTGITGGPLGGLIDTPAAQLRDYLLNYAGLTTAELSTSHWLTALTAASQQHKATSFDGSSQSLSLTASNLLPPEDSVFWTSVGNWAVDAGGTSVAWVSLADEGLHTVGLPEGVHTALKITVNGTDDDIAQVAMTLTAAQYFASAYVLLGSDGWDGDDIRVYFSDFAGSSAGTAVDVTPATDVWQRASEDNTPVGGDLAGFLSVRALSGTPASSGQTFYLACAQAVQESSLSAYERSSLWGFGDQDWWLSAWVSADDLAGGSSFQHILWGSWNGGDLGFLLSYNQSAGFFELRLTDDGTTQVNVLSAVTPADDTLYHVFAFHSATDGEFGISVNGETIVTTSHATGVWQGLGGIKVGNSTWDGTISDATSGCASAGLDFSTLTPAALGAALYNSGTILSYEEMTTEQKETWGLVNALPLRTDRDGNAFTDRHHGVAWTNTGSLTEGDSELDSGGEGLRGGVWIGGETAIQHMEVVDKFSSSFLAPFFTARDGTFALTQLTASVIHGLSGTFTSLTDELDILRDSFSLQSARQTATDIEYSFARDWHYGRWQRVYTQTNDTELASLGEGYHQSAVLWYCSDLTTANKIMAGRLIVSQENQQYAELEIPPRYHTLELNDVVSLTHFLGLGATGYSAIPFRITKLEISLMPRDAHVRLVAARNLDDAAHVDSTASAHTDDAHGDGHGDTAASSSHTDDAHADVAHDDTHNDTAHSDMSHADSHTDDAAGSSHGDLHLDDPGPIHVDSSDAVCGHGDGFSPGHADAHCDEHSDVSHGDTHGDSAHSDNPHTDSHDDTAHTNTAHGDSHTDVSHSDTPHTDVAHADSEHNDYHADSDLPHTDSASPHGDHSDVHHEDEAA